MPGDWTDEQRRIEHYHALGKPLDAAAFVGDLKTRLRSALTEFNETLPTLSHVRIFRPSKQEERGLWALTKLEAQPEPPGLEMVKERIGNRYGMLFGIVLSRIHRPTPRLTISRPLSSSRCAT